MKRLRGEVKVESNPGQEATIPARRFVCFRVNAAPFFRSARENQNRKPPAAALPATRAEAVAPLLQMSMETPDNCMGIGRVSCHHAVCEP